MNKKRVLIMGAAGRDFHNFNTFYRDNEAYEVVAFTATQIPNIDDRKYPVELAGKLYPDGIPILSEDDLEKIIKENHVDDVVFSYSDVSYEYVMDRASRALSAGANFVLLGPEATMIKSTKPVLAIGAVRTGAGKSQTSRYIMDILKDRGLKIAVVRHPMPYGDLKKQIVQRFSSIEDMEKEHCTIEEMEEYEPHIAKGNTVFAGVDYGKILDECEKEFDIVIWEGGNNDLPFYKPDLLIVIADPFRAGHEMTYYPGAAQFRMADVILINKVDTAPGKGIKTIEENAKKVNPQAPVIKASSPVSVEDESFIRGKRVLVIEDGPTLTHGGMHLGAGIIAAKKYGAKEIVDPKPYVKGSIKQAMDKYHQMANLLPCLGYGEAQLKELEEVINSVDADTVIIGTPIDVRRLININKPSTRVFYELEEKEGKLKAIIENFLKEHNL